MDDVASLLSEANSRKIALWVESGELRFRAMADGLSDDFRDRLKRHRAELIAEWPWSGRTAVARGPQRIPAYLHPLWSQIDKKELGVHFTNATHILVRRKASLDEASLSDALRQVAATHRILFARIAEMQEGPAFLFDRPDNTSLLFTNLSFLPRQKREAEAKRCAHGLVWEPFAPDNGPLIRAFAIRITQTEHIIGVVLHHFVADLVSVRIVMTEWLRRYDSLCRQGESVQSAPALAFEDHLARMVIWTQGTDAEEARIYWKEHLRNAGPTWLPRRTRAAPVRPERLATCSVRIGAKTVAAARRFAASRGATLFQLLLSAQIAALSDIGGTRDATIMFFAACRDDPKLMATVGALMNLLHLRVPFAPDDTLDDLLTKVRTAHAGAIRHQLCPFELVREIQPQVGAWNALPYAPLFNFMDTHHSKAWKKRHTPGTVASEPFDIGPAPPVALREVEFESYYFQLASKGNSLEGFLRYSPLLYEDATVRRYLDAFRKALERVCAHA